MGNIDVGQVVRNSVQGSTEGATSGSMLGGLLLTINQATDIIPPWWSTSRDKELRKFVHKCDHLSGAVYTMSAKMKSIPIKVVARDKSIKTHVALANMYTDILLASQFGEGWPKFFEKFVEDLVCQDNGAFAEVVGAGPKDGPIRGMAMNLCHLDSARCTRTGDREYPVVYYHTDGKKYKLHYSRVLFASQMPATRIEMNEVGFCAVSRVINIGQTLLDISVYKQEKLGSRPNRQILLTGGGLDPDDVMAAAAMGEAQNTAAGLTRYQKTLVMGDRNIQNPVLQIIDMSKLYDGFDERESIIIGMAIIAMGFGMDARELFPAMEAGATKADAIIQHIKERGKGPGEILQTMEGALNLKFLPPYLMAQFDFQDDTQDRQSAEIGNIRAQKRERDIKNAVTSPRVERELMVDSGELTEEQFESLELEDGRLEDGVTVDVLFFDKDPDYKKFLSGVTEGNYEQKMSDIMEIIINSRDAELIRKGRRAIAAIKYKFVTLAEEKAQREVDSARREAMIQGALFPDAGADQGNGGKKPTGKKPDTSYQQERFGRKLPRQTVNAPDETQNYQKGNDETDNNENESQE